MRNVIPVPQWASAVGLGCVVFSLFFGRVDAAARPSSSSAPRSSRAVAAATPTPPQTPTPQTKLRAQVLAFLEKEIGAVWVAPVVPVESVLEWSDKRQGTASSQRTARLQIVGEHLAVAQSLLGSPVLATRQVAFRLLCETANFAAAQLPSERVLLARLYEAWVLPHIALAYHESWQYPSRQRTIEAAYSAFERAGERDKQIKMLEWLLSLAASARPPASAPSQVTLDLNTLDWARGTLAATLMADTQAPHVVLQRAQTLLQSIESPGMTGFEHLHATLHSRLAASSPPPSSPAVSPSTP